MVSSRRAYHPAPYLHKYSVKTALVGTFRLQELFDVVLQNLVLRYAIAVFEGAEEIYGRYQEGRQDEHGWGQETVLGL